MKVFIVRHGETDYNRLRKFQGYKEIPINDLGIQQASQIADRLAEEKIDGILCSDLRRAVMTGCIVAARTAAPMHYEAALRERDVGALVDRFYEEMPQVFTEEDFVPDGGESLVEFRSRVREAFQRLGEEFEGRCERLAVITHGLVCRAFVEVFFGTEASQGVGSGNATLTIARYTGGTWTLEKATCAAHLTGHTPPPEERGATGS